MNPAQDQRPDPFPWRRGARRRSARRAPAVWGRLVSLALLVWLSVQPGAAGAARRQPLSDPQAPHSPEQLLPAREAPAITPDPAVQAMLAQAQSSGLYDLAAGLSGAQAVTIGGAPFWLTTRYTRADSYIEKATQYAYEQFQALGLAVSYHNWNDNGETRRNVAAEQAGADANCVYLLTAHLDSLSPAASRATDAPGADDNASGSAGVLTAARILSQYEFVCTLRYVLFTGEEQGLLGSEAYAAAMAAATAGQSDPIRGVINLDMIGYNTPGSAATIEIDVRSGASGNADRALSDMLVDVITAYGIGLTPLVYASDEDGSDHASFWNAGYPAILAIEDWDDHTPHYHQTSDRVDTLNMGYFTSFVKAATAAMAHLAQVTASEPPGAFHKAAPANAAGGVTMSPRLSWSASSHAAGYRYCISVSSGSCPDGWIDAGRTTSVNTKMLVSNTTYYWQVQAVNSLGAASADGGQWWSFTPVFEKGYLPIVNR